MPIQRDGEDEDFQMTEDVSFDIEASDEDPEDEAAGPSVGLKQIANIHPSTEPLADPPG